MKAIKAAVLCMATAVVEAARIEMKAKDPNLTLELKYVFEIVRHGARSPIFPADDRFPEPVQMLTPQGMR